MPRFKVNAKLTKIFEYTDEVDAPDEGAAEQAAFNKWRDFAADTFEVDKPDTWEADTEQLTFECEECGAPVENRDEYYRRDALCESCFEKMEKDGN